MKKYFITGLVILLPLTLTIAVVAFVFNFLTEPFLGITKTLLHYYGLDEGMFFLSAQQFQTIISQILILSFLLLFTFLLGLIARWFFFKYVISFWESLINRIPLVSTIYRTCQDVIKTIFANKNNAFKQVVMVPFPNAETRTIGLVTREGLPGAEKALDGELLVVFVPTTPNPTSGFLTIVKKEDVVFLNMSVEDAFKYVISCGVILAPFQQDSKLANPELIPDESKTAPILYKL